jgi:endogenous inhibitor of DNA gyrase (YacG/DUF329 family)
MKERGGKTRGMSSLETRRVRCLTCRKRGAWFAGKFGPFCSERCKLLDLGRWLGEEYRLSSPLRLEHHLEHIEDLPSTADGDPSGLTM